MLFSRFRRKNNDLMVKKPSEEVLKAHNDAEIIIKENNVDRFLLNMFMDKKGINKFHTTPELVNEFLNSDWFLNLDLKCLLQVNDESKRIRTNAFLTKKEIFFKGKENIKINLEDIIDCKIDGKKVDMICDGVSYKVMFTNKNLAKLFFDYILSHI
jgi:predicted SAM-dependent methyltransferase